MANFPPLKNHLLYCVDELIARHGVAGPFLDAGCGSGDVSLHLARKGWNGKAIDASGEAAARANALLKRHPSVRAEEGSFFGETGSYNTVLALDVIEHLEDDAGALAKLSALLSAGGHLIVSVPSNPREWRWDDEVFGHYRRYTAEGLREKLRGAGLTPLEIWDFTFPAFWWMRRAYTRLKSPPSSAAPEDKMDRTLKSSDANPWEIPVVSRLLSGDNFLWRALSRWQFARFRNRLDRGHEFVALARKDGKGG